MPPPIPLPGGPQGSWGFPNGSIVCGKIIYPGIPPDPSCSQSTWSTDWLAVFGVSWQAAFLGDLFSTASLKTTYNSAVSSNGCISLFATTVATSFVPTGAPSLADAVPASVNYLQVSNTANAIAYAASRTNYLGGTGLIYPFKSGVVRSILGRGSQYVENSPLIQVDAALLQGVVSEARAAWSGGCR